MKNNKILKYFRLIFLSLIVIFITLETYLHQVLGGGKIPSVHALCPYGGLESLYSIIFYGDFIRKIFSGTVVLLIVTIVITLLFRRSFCGLICPFGAIQEFFGMIGKKIFNKRFLMPRKTDKYLRYLKYIALILTTYYAWNTAGLWVTPYDPWSAYGHLSEGIVSVAEENLIGLIILTATIIGSLLFDRVFCKYLCPMGAFYAIVGKLVPYKIHRNTTKCIDCNMCNKNCPMNINIANSEVIETSECINCNLCVLNCPNEECLEVKSGKLIIKPMLSMSLVLLLFFGGIFVGDILGYSVTPKIESGKIISANEIKGYMTLEDVANGTDMPLIKLYEKLEIPKTVPSNTMMKNVKEYVPGFSNEIAKELIENE